MKKLNVLQRMQKDLADEKYDCSLESANEKIPFDQLLVFIGNDAMEREKILQITAVEQVMQGEGRKQAEHYHLIHFRVQLPFTVNPLVSNQTGSTILFINRMLELPGFELGEIEERVYYHYPLFISGEKVDQLLLYSVIGNIMMILDLFSGVIESVASGQKSFNDLLEEMISLTK